MLDIVLVVAAAALLLPFLLLGYLVNFALAHWRARRREQDLKRDAVALAEAEREEARRVELERTEQNRLRLEDLIRKRQHAPSALEQLGFRKSEVDCLIAFANSTES